jgi:phosphatidylglycerol:prolipoprotein diacylglycerol transferase
MLTYPNINPIAISIGPFFGVGPLRVHWYGIMYLIGFTAAWWLARYRARQPGSTWVPLDIDDLIFYGAIGVIAGGRIGWCLVYGHDVIAKNWLNAFHIWDGGMSFHGGLVGVGVAAVIFARVKHKNVADVFDFLAPLPGIGIMACASAISSTASSGDGRPICPGASASRMRTAYSSRGTPRSSMRRPSRACCCS